MQSTFPPSNIMSGALVLEGTAIPTPAPEDGVAEAKRPKIEDRVLVLREPWLTKILRGEKTLEIRNRACRRGQTWLACGGNVYGSVNITDTSQMTEKEFRNKGDQHHWPADQPPPYSKIVGWTLSEARVLEPPLPYWRPRAAMGWHLFREKEEDLPLQGRKKRNNTREGNITGGEEDGEGEGEGEEEAPKAPPKLKRQLTLQLDDTQEDANGQDEAMMEVGEPAADAAEPYLPVTSAQV